MQKLTQEQASEVLKEVYRIRKEYFGLKLRLGQTFHWVKTVGNVSDDAKFLLTNLLDYYFWTDYDLFYQEDDEKVIEMFFNNYVELGE